MAKSQKPGGTRHHRGGTGDRPFLPLPGRGIQGKAEWAVLWPGVVSLAHTERAARGALVAGASLKAPLSASKPRATPGTECWFSSGFSASQVRCTLG